MPDAARILSDLHFGDRSSRIGRLAQLRPLLEGPTALVLNGDTLDTRPGAAPGETAALRAEVLDFFRRETPTVTLLTGNHDADISDVHALDLAGGRVFATHGDVLFDDIVPWSRDAAGIARLIAAETANSSAALNNLAHRLALWRRVAGQIPQRHQSETNPLKHLLHLAGDTVWPPTRILRIIRAWREAPTRAAALLRLHRPAAKLILTGHTHQPGCWRMPDGIIVLNTGSFCAPLGGCVVDVLPERVVMRRIAMRGGEFYAGRIVADFALAAP